MPANLLLLPLLGGYWFVHFCYYFRFRAQRLDGYWLLLESAIAGVAFAALSRLIVGGLKLIPWGFHLAATWGRFSPFPYSGSALGALALGCLFPWLVNWIWNEQRSKNKLLERHPNALFRLLHDSASKTRPIALTLDTRKWYMGYVRESPNLDPQEQYFTLIPVLSGYRDSDTLAVETTVMYDPVSDEGKNKNDFAITIPLASVKSAHYFDKDVYERSFATRR